MAASTCGGGGRRSSAIRALVLWVGGALVAGAQYSNLYSFTGVGGEGANPMDGQLLASGSFLYGTTPYGGLSSNGVVFRIGRDGTGYTNLHLFADGPSDGRFPSGSLTITGVTFYGMTSRGGLFDSGTVFRVLADGTGYSILHHFSGGASDGAFPSDALALSGSTLYGMTGQGGGSQKGVVFRINTDGTGYTNLHAFSGSVTDGASPRGSLTLIGSTLFGMTEQGGRGDGSYQQGVLFSMETDGSRYTNLHSFSAGTSDGARPHGSLVAHAGVLYGMTSGGGSNDYGTIFRIATNGTGYAILKKFAGATDGYWPDGSLTLHGATLYGMTAGGGGANWGTVFQIGTDGSSHTVLHSFTGSASDGHGPYGSLCMDNWRLYGMTYWGGVSNRGVIFSHHIPPAVSLTAPSASVAFRAPAAVPVCAQIAANGHAIAKVQFFGVGGVLAEVTNPPYAATLSNPVPTGLLLRARAVYEAGQAATSGAVGVSIDAVDYGVLHAFGTQGGRTPLGSLSIAGSHLFGMTSAGGSAGKGVVFRMGFDGVCTGIHTFTGGGTDGATPLGSLTVDGSFLYGVTRSGGSSNRGVAFRMALDGSGYTNLHGFIGGTTDGGGPMGALLLVDTNLYGMTEYGGTANYGVLFRMGTNGSGYSVLKSFTGGTGGRKPMGSLILNGATLYGMTSMGGLNSQGSIFSIRTDGTAYSNVYSFSSGASSGGYPYGALCPCGSRLFGLLSSGGRASGGTIFAVNLNGTGYTNLYSLSAGSTPYGSLIGDRDTLYGMTHSGGAAGEGTIFSISTNGQDYTSLHTFTGVPDGGRPYYGQLIRSGDAFYGMTSSGGAGYGTVFWFVRPGMTGYPAWAARIPGALTNYTDSAVGDGYPNLLKYATGSAPLLADDLARLVGTVVDGRYGVQFNRHSAATDVTIRVEATSNLTLGAAGWICIASNVAGSWGGASNITEDATAQPSRVTLCDPESASPIRFFRLQVARP